MKIKVIGLWRAEKKMREKFNLYVYKKNMKKIKFVNIEYEMKGELQTEH